MAKVVTISFETSNLDVIRNFSEKLSLSLNHRALGFLSMDDADRAIEFVRVTRIHSRNLRRALVLIDELIDEFGLRGKATVSPEL